MGDKVILLDKVSKGFGQELLIDQLSLAIPKGAVVGIIGGNGAGKSTLFRMIAGTEKPDSGSITLGETVKVAYVEQTRDALNDNDTVWQAISDGHDILTIGSYEVSSRAYVGRFNFRGTDQQKRVGDLSGGERGRLHLANTLKQGANVLLLDEPSNDLDIETLRALEEAILSFPGCVLVISHDRWFLDRIATHTLAYEDDGEVVFFEGSYSEYHDDFVKRNGGDAQPTRVQTQTIKGLTMSAIWHRRPDPLLIGKMSQGTIDEHLEIIITDVGDDYLTGTMPADKRTFQPYGVVHGGANVVLAESLGSIAGAHVIDSDQYICPWSGGQCHPFASCFHWSGLRHSTANSFRQAFSCLGNTADQRRRKIELLGKINFGHHPQEQPVKYGLRQSLF